ncbi:MAG: hypothetical protein AAGJ91_08705 [Pseudomonadota bacterium]
MSLPDAGRSLVIGNGWENVAQTAPDFIEGQTSHVRATPLRAVASLALVYTCRVFTPQA